MRQFSQRWGLVAIAYSLVDGNPVEYQKIYELYALDFLQSAEYMTHRNSAEMAQMKYEETLRKR